MSDQITALQTAITIADIQGDADLVATLRARLAAATQPAAQPVEIPAPTDPAANAGTGE